MTPSFPSRILLLAVGASLLLGAGAPAADPRPRDPLGAGDLRLALARLRVAGTALYVAAHPDDENTAMLAWLARGRKVRTVYLSMTRGDGGQNLIGDEFGAELGVIRTQELLAARRVDGAEQRFTRALDFGYSKGPEETMEFWGRDSTLADVVWAIRSLEPDVVVTRFPTDGQGGHGHHTASAQLALQAFEVAGDPAANADQLARGVRPWRPTRLMWNAWSPDRVRPDSTWLRVDLGAYEPLLGRSWTEFAGISRSNHKSQGFGAPERRGTAPNSLAPMAGATARGDLFDGVDLSWSRFPGGGKVDAALAEAERRFDPSRPAAILPLLARAWAAMEALPPRPIVAARRAELAEVMRSCAGLWLEAVSSAPEVVAGRPVRVATMALARGAAATLVSVTLPGSPGTTAARALIDNVPLADTLVGTPARDADAQPYWLRSPAAAGRFRVADPLEIGQPENVPALSARFVVELAGVRVPFDVAVAHRWTDPVLGERWRSLAVVPAASLALDEGVYLFPDSAPRRITVRVTAAERIAGRARLELPPGWHAEPAAVELALAAAGEEARAGFLVTPATGAGAFDVHAVFESEGRRLTQGLVRIDHAHVPLQVLLPPARAKLVRSDVVQAPLAVGYVMGSGDPVPAALRQLGCAVTLLEDDDLEHGDLSRFRTIVTGVRAYNTRPRLRALQPRLLDWVRDGGTLVVQYNTADRSLPALGPLPFTLSRDRVTREDADVVRRAPEHALLQRPNRIGADDFAGWVQERGLYFANPFDPGYDAVLASHDPGEPDRDGGLLHARHGRGVFIYCAYAMFRQLPAGVPGAYRLLANLVSARP